MFHLITVSMEVESERKILKGDDKRVQHETWSSRIALKLEVICLSVFINSYSVLLLSLCFKRK